MPKDVYAEKRLQRLWWMDQRMAFTPGELADYMNTSRVNALKYLRKLREEGLVVEVERNWWCLTRKGDEAVTKLHEALERRKENERKED
jgi:Mn-dependent DtxR family transcriptional regulator